jgi:4'-phosphopantetheinyl transferase
MVKLNQTSHINFHIDFLDEHTFHIFIFDLDEWSNFDQSFLDILSQQEKDQALRFINSTLSTRYIRSHAILRILLSNYSSTVPHQILYNKNKFGKPYLNNSCIKFNMSHTSNYAAYIISYKQEVGIDVEYIDYQLDIYEILPILCNQRELNFITQASTQKQYSNFFTLWSTKEAVYKSLGYGTLMDVQNQLDAYPILQKLPNYIQWCEYNYWVDTFNTPYPISAIIAIQYPLHLQFLKLEHNIKIFFPKP